MGDAPAAPVSLPRCCGGAGALSLLVRHDLRESEARGVIDADVNELSADAAAVALAGAVAGNAMTDPIEVAELFDVEVDHLAGVRTLIAYHRGGRFEGTELVQSEPGEDPADRCRRQANRLGNLLAGPALASQLGDALDVRCRGRPVQVVRPRAAIAQPGDAFCPEARDLFVDRLDAHPKGGGHRPWGLPGDDPADHDL